MSLSKFTYWLLALIVCLTPLLVTSALLAIFNGATFFDFAPQLSDERFHWHQALSFKHVGFDNGYYTVAEVPPALDGFRYYAWSFTTYAFYGLVGRVVGWAFYTPLLLHASLITLGLAGFIGMTRPQRWQMGLMALFLAGFIPTLLYLPTAMQQGLHQAIAIIMATGLYGLLKGKLTRPYAYLFFAFIILTTFIRPTWGLLIFPALLFYQHRHTPLSFVRISLISAFIFIAISYIFQMTSAPYPAATATHLLDAFALSFTEGLAAFFTYLLRTVYALFTIPDFFGIQTLDVLRGQRLLLLAIFLWSTYHAWRLYRLRQAGGQDFKEAGFHAYNITLTFLLVLALNGDISRGHDYRIMAPHLLLSALLLIALARWQLVLVLMALTLPFYSQIPQIYFDLTSRSYTGAIQTDFQHWSQAFEQAGMVYDADADNAWCNSLLTSTHYIHSHAGVLLAVDAGIGLSFFFPHQGLPTPPRSAYLLLRGADLASAERPPMLEKMLDVPDGALYRNLESACPSP